MDNLYCPR